MAGLEATPLVYNTPNTGHEDYAPLSSLESLSLPLGYLILPQSLLKLQTPVHADHHNLQNSYPQKANNHVIPAIPL